MPDGRIQIVTYHADENGYVADVKYEGEAAPYVPEHPVPHGPVYPPPPPKVVNCSKMLYFAFIFFR